MTVYELSQNSQFNVLTMPELEREINGVYIGDLLIGDLLQDQGGNARLRIEHWDILQHKSPHDILYHRKSHVATVE